MIPMSFTETDQAGYMRRMADNYVEAVRRAGVKRVVVLSGWAADLLAEGSAEQAFDGLTDVAVCILRPASFYSNFYMSMDLIRGKGWIGKFLTLRYSGVRALCTGKTGLLMGNFGGDDRTVFVSPKDIAVAAAEELNALLCKIRYVGSEEMTCNEAARIIGTAVGKPWLKWVRISDKAMLRGLKMAKMPEKLAASLVEMQAAMHKGTPLANFHRNNPRMGKVKLTEFAKEFAVVYKAQKP
jgi:NAD(P)H dehydrogenase (quinone)